MQYMQLRTRLHVVEKIIGFLRVRWSTSAEEEHNDFDVVKVG